MKYDNWDSYTIEQKTKAVEEEIRLVTHNGTTKDDMMNIIRFLGSEVERLKSDKARLYTSYEALVDYGYIDKRRIDDCRQLIQEVQE